MGVITGNMVIEQYIAYTMGICSKIQMPSLSIVTVVVTGNSIIYVIKTTYASISQNKMKTSTTKSQKVRENSL